MMRRSDRIELFVVLILFVWIVSAVTYTQSQDAINATLSTRLDDAIRRLGNLEDQQNRVIWGVLALIGFKAWEVLERKRSRT